MQQHAKPRGCQGHPDAPLCVPPDCYHVHMGQRERAACLESGVVAGRWQWKGVVPCMMLQLAELKDGWEKSLNGNLRCGICFSCQKSGRSGLLAVVNVQAVVSPDIIIPSPFWRSIFKS